LKVQGGQWLGDADGGGLLHVVFMLISRYKDRPGGNC
jgi:hypothetical protein